MIIFSSEVKILFNRIRFIEANFFRISMAMILHTLSLRLFETNIYYDDCLFFVCFISPNTFASLVFVVAVNFHFAMTIGHSEDEINTSSK